MESPRPNLSNRRETNSASHEGGILDTVASTGADLLIQHGIPWLGKKAVEMGRYYGSEAMRNPKIQKKAIDYALDQLNPMIQNVGSQALNQLSTKIRPKKKYKTNRKDLDGGALYRRKPTVTDKIAEGLCLSIPQHPGQALLNYLVVKV